MNEVKYKGTDKSAAIAKIASVKCPPEWLEGSELDLMNRAWVFGWYEDRADKKDRIKVAYCPQRHYDNGAFLVYVNGSMHSEKDFKYSENSTKYQYRSHTAAFTAAMNYAKARIQTMK